MNTESPGEGLQREMEQHSRCAPANGGFRLKPRSFERLNEEGSSSPRSRHGNNAEFAGSVAGSDAKAILHLNYIHELRAGRFALGPLDDSKRKGEIRKYLWTVLGVGVPGLAVALIAGPSRPFIFVLAISAVVLVSVRATWKTFFLRTHY